MSYPRIRDLEGCVGPTTPGVQSYGFNTWGGHEPDRLYFHAVLALNEDDAVDELLRHYFKDGDWVAYLFRSVAHWDGEKWVHFLVKGMKVTNETTPHLRRSQLGRPSADHRAA